MEHWTWLARWMRSEEGRKNALKLAQALGDHEIEVEMIEMRMHHAPRMPAQEILELE